MVKIKKCSVLKSVFFISLANYMLYIYDESGDTIRIKN